MKKKYDYIVSLKRPDFKKYDLISQLLLIVAIIIFLFFLFNNIDAWVWYSLPVIVITAQIIYNLFERRKGEIVRYRLSFIVDELGFIILGVFGLPTILLTVLYIIPL